MRVLARILLILLVFSVISACDDDDVVTTRDYEVEEGGRPPEDWNGPVTRILEDTVHSIKQNTRIRLKVDDFRYSHMFGYYRLFEMLNLHGYSHDRLIGGKITPELLSHYDVYFLNLMDSSRPRFTQDEIEALREFVEQGGGMFVIGDHTNVYLSSEMTNPMLEPYGISIRYEIACDRPPHSVVGNGWILVEDFEDHPVTTDLDGISLQTGAPIDGPGGVAFTSPDGWGDFWDPNMEEGFYGNWTQDPTEPSGPQAVVQAVQYGQGRVVVVGDQNIFGDPYLFFLSNKELALNGFEWVAHRTGEDLRDVQPPGINVRIDSLANNLSMGQGYNSSYYTFYTNLNRRWELTAHATRIPLQFTPKVFMEVEPTRTVAEDNMAECSDVLDNGGVAMLVLDPGEVSAASLSFIESLGIGSLELTADGTDFMLGGSVPPRVVEDVEVQLPGGKSATLPKVYAIHCPDPLIGSDDGDVVCRYSVGSGEFWLVMAAQDLRNAAMGDDTEVPTGSAAECFDFQMGLVDLVVDRFQSGN